MFKAFFVKKGSAKGCWGVIYLWDVYVWVAVFDPDTLMPHAVDRIEIVLHEDVITCSDIDGAEVHAQSPDPYLNKTGVKGGNVDKAKESFSLKEKAGG